ncbi:type IV pilus biogenesis/stability protein PilW [Legionella fallonii]|uniref:type IV pilus biogenesis/stability protein PilW n=1 Tax=Legionella fallonii TaxID=96230 RepID=UPI00155AFAC2|nr:type IV pilus biogenesis/stability protein PilW [Legionella fallonii]
MHKALRFLIIMTCLFLLACHQTKSTQVDTVKKPDLKKAALFNVQLGLGYLKQGDRPRAKKKLLLALEQEPNSPDVNAAMAYYNEQTNELEKAKNYYLKAISLSGNDGAQLNNYGTFLCRQGEYKKAEGYFLKAVKDEHYIHTAGAYENAGLCAQAIPDLNKAKHYFTTALNQDPTRKVSLYELAKIESKEGHDTEALNLIQKNPELVLNDKIFLALAKEIAEKAGKFDLAAEYENNFNKIDPHTNNSGVNNEYSASNG